MDYLAIELPGGKIVNPPSQLPRGGLSALAKAINVALNLLLVFALVYALIMILWGAVLWISSSGEKQNVEKAREKIKFALIGLILAFASFMIMSLISRIFGVSLLII